MNDSSAPLSDMMTPNIRPLRNVIDKYRKASLGTNNYSSTLAGKPQHVVDDIRARVDVMRVRHEQGLDLWTGEPLGDEKGPR